MRRGDNEINAAANVEMPRDAHPLRRASRNHRVQKDVGDIFVEVALIPKTPQILLDTLRFQAPLRGAVFNDNRGKVRLTRERAQCREFDGRKLDRVGVVRVRVGKRLEFFRDLKRGHSPLPTSL